MSKTARQTHTVHLIHMNGWNSREDDFATNKFQPSKNKRTDRKWLDNGINVFRFRQHFDGFGVNELSIDVVLMATGHIMHINDSVGLNEFVTPHIH